MGISDGSMTKIPLLLACFPPETLVCENFLRKCLDHLKPRIATIEMENDWACRIVFESKSAMDVVHKETKGMLRLDSGDFITLLTEENYNRFSSYDQQRNRRRNPWNGSQRLSASPLSSQSPLSDHSPLQSILGSEDRERLPDNDTTHSSTPPSIHHLDLAFDKEIELHAMKEFGVMRWEAIGVTSGHSPPRPPFFPSLRSMTTPPLEEPSMRSMRNKWTPWNGHPFELPPRQ